MTKRRKSIIWTLIILAVASGGYFLLRSQKPLAVYATADVTRGNLAQTVSVTGKIIPERDYNLSFETSGRIISLNYRVGDRVKKGEKLASIETGTLLSQLAGARAEVEAQKKTLAAMKDKKDFYNKNQRKAQEEIIKKAEASVSAIYNQLQNAVIYSPVDGIVIKRNYNVGEMSAPGALVLAVAEESDLICEVNVPESDILKIKIGQQAKITVEAFSPDEKFDAVISKIEPAATIIQDVVYYKTQLEIKSPDTRFKIGMSADIDIKTAEANNVLIVPLRAVKTENEKEYVEILKTQNRNQLLEKIFVKTGLRGDEGMVEIVSGLSGGEKVVTSVKNGK